MYFYSQMTRQQAGDYKDRVRQEYNDLVEEEATRSRLSDVSVNARFCTMDVINIQCIY